ncbi:hypothetical protein [Burkholderia gladioli]|uniref:hypothetical protein n=1 Tax=Burkholderia gladioli TaxID=28095 RepID=UPI001FC8AEC2|nr:hypothetical protein [Burkholderia gladioli]
MKTTDERTRKERTPATEADDLLEQLRALWISVCPDGSAEAFAERVWTPLTLAESITGEDFEGDFERLRVTAYAELTLWPLIDIPITIALAYTLNAMYADASGSTNLAWTYIQDATYWHGVSFALAKVSEDSPTKSISDVARSAALKKNKENRAIKGDAFAWLNANFDEMKLTVDQAAEKLGSVVPMAFSTRRSYVTEWKSSR